MSKLKDKKPNVPKIAFEDYFWHIAGIPKSGKTSLFVKVMETYFGDINAGLLIGWEKGYTALKVVAEDMNEWGDFEELVDELVESKDELPYKVIGLDTVDVMYEMAVDTVVKEWNRKNPSRRTDDIGGVGQKKQGAGGYGVGYQMVKQKIRKQIDRLMKAGYGIMSISHSKDKEVEQRDGQTFDQLVVSLPQSARDVFVNMADFVVFLTVEKEKSGNDVLTKRYMYFRSDGYIDAGSRFSNVPERIEYDINEFIRVFEEAVRTEFGDVKNVEKVKKEQKKERDQKSKKYVEKEKSKKTSAELIEEITATIKTFSKEQKEEAKNEIVEIIGNPNYLQIEDVEVLEECLKKINDLKKE